VGSSIPKTNYELQLADRFVEQTGSNIFLTGKAGTGKTTFLKSLQQKTDKRLVITAPTGVAAINAGGVTLHSFFQLPLGPFVPGSELHNRGKRSPFRFSKEKKKILKCLDLLVIDEISMVRADILDAVDAVLRRYRDSDNPFGGVQLLMIGDLHQLPPVAKKEEWELLRQYYDSVYFFSSKSLLQSGFTSIELKHIYRQTDEMFIKILNQLRDNRLDKISLSELNKRYVKDFVPGNERGFITLTTHNLSAESLNGNRLQVLDGNIRCFDAEITGEFPKNSYPAPEELKLKKGAQVMFLRNDTATEKRYYNGKIGKVVKISADEIDILCPDESRVITVGPVIWENIKYTLHRKEMKVEEEVIGSFKQFPLKLAWAITIHKSQGLTFENAIIDAEEAFVHGQTYVALSRCKTLEGVVLNSPISPHGINSDRTIRDFDQRIRQNPTSPEHLEKAKIRFQQKLLLDCFDYNTLKNSIDRLGRLVIEHSRTIQVLGLKDSGQLANMVDLDIFDISEKFIRQLQRIFQSQNLPESDPHILERIQKASKWFQEQLTETVLVPLHKIQLETDNSILAGMIKEALLQLKREINVKLEGAKSLENGFSPSDYQQQVYLAGAEPPPDINLNKSIDLNLSELDSDHPELIAELKQWRSQKADKEEISSHRILHQRALFEIARTLPNNEHELRKIKGLGKKTVQKRGEEIIAIISQYRKNN